MKSSRMSIKKLLDKKMLKNIEKLDGQFVPVQLKSLLTFYSVHGKLLNLKFNYQNQDNNIHLNQVQLLLKSEPNKEHLECIKVLVHFGEDKFHIQLSNSLPLNGLYHFSMIIFSLKENKTIQNQPNFQLLLLLVIQLVFSALLSHIQLILWSQNFTVKKKDKVKLQVKFMVKSDLKDYGEVLEQELS